MKGKSLISLLKGYSNGWISISTDYKKVLASGKTLEVVLQKLAKLGNPKGVLMRASKDFSRYAGNSV